jgi:Fibronectin type III domain/Trypsin-like peptidase domain
MKTKIRSLITFVLLSGAWVTMLFALPNTPPSGNPQTEPAVTVPSVVSASSDNGGMRTRADSDLPSARYGAQIDLNQPSVSLEQLDVRSFTLEPNQIGVNRSVEVSPNTRAQKFVNPDGSQIIVLIIKSTGASGVGVHFRNFALGEGEEVYVYGAGTDSIVFGPYTDKGPWGSGEFWSGTIDGDTIVVEFYTRRDEDGKGFEIFEISHIFTELDWRLRSNEPDVLYCELDASCYGDAEKNAVGRIVFNKNGLVYLCTGTLLNDLAQDHTPYFLTANHCVNTQAVAQTVEVYWFYQTTSCNSGVLRTWVHSPPGANLLATQSSNDFCLLRLLNNAPGGAVFSGWTGAGQSTGIGVFGLHHPGPYAPPIVDSYLRRSGGSITSTNYNCAATGLVNGYIASWTSGAAEHGSSGSGLWNSGHYLVGVASCGPVTSYCLDWQSYSKFANFYSQIQPYIGVHTPSPPIANPATLVASNSFTANWSSVSGATGYRLDVSTTSSFSTYVPGYQNLNVGNAISRSVTGLNASTRYYYRVRAYNSNGTSGNSNVVSVTTLTPTGPPVVITNPATWIASFSATLNSTVDPHGLVTMVYFQYGTTISYGHTTVNQNKTGNTYQNVAVNMSGLTANTVYHFRVVATNGAGTRFGSDRIFVTLTTTGPPVVTTNPATNVTSSSAALNGTVDPHGLSTTVYFQYGRTTSYGSRTPNQTKSGNNYQNVSANISGLSAGATYHFRIVASNTAGTRYGNDRAFITP